MHFLTAGQVEALAEAITPGYATLIRFAAYTGLRPGELVALRVGRLNLLRGSCEVVASASEVGGRLMWGATKTYARRSLRLPRFLSEEPAGYLALAGRPRGPGDLLFTAPLGGPLRENNFMRRHFKPAVTAANSAILARSAPGERPVLLPEALRMHDLRHTCASLLIAQGASVKAIQEQLGHASATVTLDRYGHLYDDALDRLAERLDQARAEAVGDRVGTHARPTVVALPKPAGR
jgi:integrase